LSLTPGTRLGVYEIIAQIGEGGMGQVFRARDTKLNRDVALKVLPDSFAHDIERLARFTREAQTLAHMSRAIRALTGSPLGGWRRSNPFKTGHARAA
jgi:serine/threonine protein kinase